MSLSFLTRGVRYDLMNGDPATVRPYFLGTPEAYKWVRIGGVTPENALRCMDAFIKSHQYHIERNAPAMSTPESRKKAGFILGVMRCVMMAGYELTEKDFVPGELAGPHINVSFSIDGNPEYEILVAEDEQPEIPEDDWFTETGARVSIRAKLSEPLILSVEEKAVLRTLTRSAQAVIPLQGFSLMTDSDEYLSTPDSASFKAFQAVERQVWTDPAAATFLNADIKVVRDLMWCKSGQPVDPCFKEKLSTMPQVKAKLIAAGLSSAATRIPCVEPVFRSIETFYNLTNVCKLVIQVNNQVFADVRAALDVFPYGHGSVVDESGRPREVTFGPYGDNGRSVTVKSRYEIVKYARDLIQKSKGNTAICYGVFCKMMDEPSTRSAVGENNFGLLHAYSLKKLKYEFPLQYVFGYETEVKHLLKNTAQASIPKKHVEGVNPHGTHMSRVHSPPNFNFY